ncbi:Ntn hydrolase superfamily protein [Emydomyces testavorans]|uniref:ceramidase n=1 Tax=Emydomyces testavorans TaxID=2070801 RepID=A0AAF0DCR9_9EURO|nr:Ntn hydrolase superfamily protein [Emydomyces testavorans]
MYNAANLGDVPPVFRIDLSLPPSERYMELAKIYCERLRSLTGLFDELVASLHPKISVIWVKRAARLFLRKLYTHEETEEIKGISLATGIDMHLLVSLNVLLDLLMGCTSGAALTKEHVDEDAKMLHFRTLDWGMDGLRQLIVQLEYVRSPDTETVLATSITYVGFVGVLTGVRKGLSVSLNFRPNHDMSSAWRNFRFYGGHLLVLLGVRRSISSLLRQCLLPSVTPKSSWIGWFPGRQPKQPRAVSLDIISAVVPKIPSTAAYLIFCDGASAVVMEKDHRSAVIHSSSSFIVATNSDLETTSPSYQPPTRNRVDPQAVPHEDIMIVDIIEDSNERRACMQANWDKKVRAIARDLKQNNTRQMSTEITAPQESMIQTRSSNEVVSLSAQNAASSDMATFHTEVTATPSEIVQWTATYPITADATHFATVMDPLEGRIFWLKRYKRPLFYN